MKRFIASLVVAVFGITAVASAQTSTINVNIISGAGTGGLQALDGTDQSAPGLTPIDPAGLFWNDIGGDLGGAAGVALVESSAGGGTGITLSQTSTGGNMNGSFSFSQPGLLADAPDILGNYLAATNNFGNFLDPVEFQLSGLSATSTFDIYFVAVGDTPGQGATITVDGVSQSSTGTSPSGPLTLGDNVIVFSDLTADVDGNLDFSLAPTSDPLGSPAFAALSGFQIVETPAEVVVPEPATAGLATLLLVAGVGVRRRR